MKQENEGFVVITAKPFLTADKLRLAALTVSHFDFDNQKGLSHPKCFTSLALFESNA